MKNPNAFAALITTGAAAGLLSLAHRLGYAHLTTEQAIGVAGGAVTGVLFVGRRVGQQGIKGIVKSIWNGSRAVVNGTAPKP